MEYNHTVLPDRFSVEGIVTVLYHTFASGEPKQKGEAHDFPEILYIHKGVHRPVVDGTEYTLSAGQMMIYAPGAFHTSFWNTDAEAFILSFRIAPEAVAPLCNRVISATPTQKQLFLQIIEDGRSCFRKYNEEEKRQGKHGMTLREDADEATLERMKKQLEFFLIELRTSLQTDRKTVKRGRDFDQVTEYLTQRLGEALTLKQIAEGCGMSVSKLKLLFREKSGGGVIDYFNDRKIARAKEMIREGERNVTEIAEDLGFSSLHYFSRLFKQITGLSPTEYAKRK